MRALDERVRLYEETTDPSRIAALQLARLNAHWERAWKTTPFYAKWRADHGLPERIGGLDELADFPVLTKKAISDARELVAQSPDNERYTLTGGTSGISTAFPMNGDDAESAWVDTHVGRAWNGIAPQDRLFMIWGHSHLFSGKGAALKQIRRRVKDGLNNIRRISAYNLDTERLDAIAREIAADRPAYIIGYGSCLSRLALHLLESGRTLRDAGVTRVVNTSETLDASDAGRLEEVFGCPVINEYGMAEAGVIGYSVGALYPIRVFWNDFVVRTDDRRLILTTLGARCFPLINYDTEDLCPDPVPDDGALLFLSELGGKTRDIFEMRDVHGGRHEVSVILFDHVLKQIAPLRSLHYELEQGGTVKVRYTTDGPALDDDELSDKFALGMKLEGVEIAPSMVQFEWLEKPLQTAAGKRWALVQH